MKHLLLTLLSLFLTLKQICAIDNTTQTPETTDISTTEMYTSPLITATLADVTVEDDPADPDEDVCTFEIILDLESQEGITITLCGYIEKGDDDTDVAYVGITLQLPSDRWCGVGFILDENYDESDPMKGAYSIIVPQYSRNIQEISFNNRVEIKDNNVGTALTNSIQFYEDKYDDNMRIIKLKRKLKISINDLGNDNADQVLKYFDFTKIQACNTKFKMIYAFGSSNEQRFKLEGSSFHGYNNAGFENAQIEGINGKSCKSIIDSTNKISIITAVIMTIVTVIAVVY